MKREPEVSKTTSMVPKAPKGLGFQGMVVSRATAMVGSRSMLRGLFMSVLVTAGALEAIRFGMVEHPVSLAISYQNPDPVVAVVGDEVLRVSDAFAHAAFTSDSADEYETPSNVPALIESGTVDEVADHLALAQAARQVGLADELEIRAALALAERQILAEAYLDQIKQRAVTEDAIRQHYAEETAALARDGAMVLSKIVVGTKEKAAELRERLPRADFGTLAKKHSIDASSQDIGGALGELRARDLDPVLAAAASDLVVGGVSAPLETEEGWTLLKLEARRALRLPPLDERRGAIEFALQQEAIAAAVAEARSDAPMRLRSADAIENDFPVQSIAAVRSEGQ